MSYSVQVGNLKPYTAYQFIVMVSNEVGGSESEVNPIKTSESGNQGYHHLKYETWIFEQKFKVRTHGESPSDTPKSVRVRAIDATQLRVSWDQLDGHSWNDASLSFRVVYKRHR